MAYLIDTYVHTTCEIDGHWVISRPLPGTFWDRLRDAWLVLIGKADAVTFYGQ